MFDRYWREPRPMPGPDANDLAERVLTVFGAGTYLDVGCGDGRLVQALLRHGMDASGVDVSPVAIARCERSMPGRCAVSDVCALPHADASVDVAVAVRLLDSLPEEHVAGALRELARVARRGVFVFVMEASGEGPHEGPHEGPSAGPGRDDSGMHATRRPREWWEARAYEAGLRRHPRSMAILPYASIEQERPHVTLALEVIAIEARERYPLSALRAGRDLHMDMLREAGRRGDAHVARYALAAEVVRPGDVVLDAACGLGYGASVLLQNSQASRVIGLDADARAVEYAQANYGLAREGEGPRVEFRLGDVHDLSPISDASVDVVASFETLEHVRDPERVLAEFARVLTPGGRLIASVPNDWTDATGKDPNPHHLHVYTYDALRAQVRGVAGAVGVAGGALLVERVHRQVAGGGMKLTDQPRQLQSLHVLPDGTRPEASGEGPAEWWIITAMKDPVAATVRDGSRGVRALPAYVERSFPGPTNAAALTGSAGADLRDADGAFHTTAFARDYENAWLVRAIVSRGTRALSAALLRDIALRAERVASPASADRGAALCVLAYQALGSGGQGAIFDADLASGLLARLDDFERACEAVGAGLTPHAHRWRISNRYAGAHLRLARGDTSGADEAFVACAEMDALAFSPLLATKTVEAWYHAGLLAASRGERGVARERWARGVASAERALRHDWLNVLGDRERPLAFAMLEVSLIADHAGKCAHMLRQSGDLAARPGKAWTEAATENLWHRWMMMERLERARRWLDDQRENLLRVSAWQASRIKELEAWGGHLREAAQWHEQQSQNWQQHAASLKDLSDQLAQHARSASTPERSNASASEGLGSVGVPEEALPHDTAHLRERAGLLLRQVEELKRAIAERERALADLRDWSQTQEQGRAWLQGQVESLRTQLEAHANALRETRTWVEEMSRARAWHEEQSSALRAELASRDGAVAQLRQWTGALEESKRWLEGERRSLLARVAEQDQHLRETQAWGATLREGLEWMTAQRDHWQAMASGRAPQSPATGLGERT
jgi:SAM-dependent methyltransferase